MLGTNRSLTIAFAAAVAVACAITVLAQAPPPLRGQQGQPQGQAQGRGRGRGAEAPAPSVSPLATISDEVTAPGQMFQSLMSLPEDDDLAHFKYVQHEYWATGTANGQSYKTRIVVRRPADNAKFSGIVLAESMHPSGNAWMFHYTHTYTMSAGHVGLEIVTTDPAQFVDFNKERYSDMKIGQGQASEILAQVGATIRSKEKMNPLADVTIRKMILSGTSASSGTLVNYLPTSLALRLPGMKPIYDGFLPTSNGANIQKVDVPLIQIPTMREASAGGVPTRQDSDEAGDQYRDYEFPGMGHLDSKYVEAFRPNPCKYPVSMFPLGAYMSVGLEHLVAWVDKGTVPPRAPGRMIVDRNTANDGSLMMLDEYGNPTGGIRNPYVDYPVMTYSVPNVAADPQPPGVVPWVATRGLDGINQLCGLTAYQTPLKEAQLKKLYKNKADYVAKFTKKVDEMTKEGWSLPVYREQLLNDAQKVNF